MGSHELQSANPPQRITPHQPLNKTFRHPSYLHAQLNQGDPVLHHKIKNQRDNPPRVIDHETLIVRVPRYNDRLKIVALRVFQRPYVLAAGFVGGAEETSTTEDRDLYEQEGEPRGDDREGEDRDSIRGHHQP